MHHNTSTDFVVDPFPLDMFCWDRQIGYWLIAGKADVSETLHSSKRNFLFRVQRSEKQDQGRHYQAPRKQRFSTEQATVAAQIAAKLAAQIAM